MRRISEINVRDHTDSGDFFLFFVNPFPLKMKCLEGNDHD